MELTASYKKRGLKTQLFVIVFIAMFAITGFELVSFSQIQKIFNRKAQSYLESQMKQIQGSIDETLTFIRTLGYQLVDNSSIKSLLSEERTVDVLKAAKISDDIITLFSSANSNISDIVLCDIDGNMMSYLNQFTIFEYRMLEEKYDFGAQKVQSPYYYAWTDSESSSRFFLAFILPVYEPVTISLNKKSGSLIIYSYFDDLDSLINNPGIAEGESYYLLDSDGSVLAANQMADYKFPEDGRDRLKGNSVFSRTDLGFLGWSLRGSIKNNVLSGEYKLANQLIFFNLLLIVILLAVIIWVVNRNITKPISIIARDISDLALYDKGIRMPEHSQAELEMIVSSVNGFLDEIKSEHEEVLNKTALLYENNLARKQTELSALQSQINPHFLYNTLECMRSIGAAYDSREIMDISTAMASIFRYSIQDAHMVTLAEEISVIEEYLRIMDIRFGSKYKYSICIPGELLSCKILKMTIQPLVENAFYHGLEKCSPAGKLVISGEKRDHQLIITVSDSGQGIGEFKLHRLRRILSEGVSGKTRELPEEKKIGMMNIHFRCFLAYGSDYGINVDSTEGEGTSVSLNFPLDQK